MPFNGSGGTSQPGSSIYPAVANTLIESAKFNISVADLYSMLGSCIVKDGQQVTTQRIPFAQGIQTDTVTEKTADTGVTLDSVLLKDGRIDTTQGSDIVCSATINLETATGNVVDVTGSTGPVTAITLSQGHWRIVRFTGTPTLTHGASLVLPGSANIVVAAGDYAIFAGYATSVVRCVAYYRANGGTVLISGAGYVNVGTSSTAQAAASLPPSPINLSLAFSVASSNLTVAVKGRDGNDPSAANPVLIPFRNVTAATGDFSWIALTAATSIVIDDTSTLGTINSTAFRLWCVAFNDGGTVRLGLINCVATATTLPNIYPLAGFGIASATEETTGADSAHVFYSNGAAVSSKAYTVLGYATWESGLATSGTWSAAPTRTQVLMPGVPLPGAIIRTVIDTDATEVSSTADTFVTTNLEITFTPDSAANVIKLEASTTGGTVATDNSTGATAEFQIARGAATGTSLATRQLRIIGDGGSFATWAVAAPIHILAFDTNQSASTTYTVALRDVATGTAYAQRANSSGILTATELMT